MEPTVALRGSPTASGRLVLGSASTARMGVFPAARSLRTINAASVVLPTPPLPPTAILIPIDHTPLFNLHLPRCSTSIPGNRIAEQEELAHVPRGEQPWLQLPSARGGPRAGAAIV